jgi:hypothetical protein
MCTLFPQYAAPVDADSASSSGAVYYTDGADNLTARFSDLKGFNYFPASSMNDIDMWRDGDYNEAAIVRDLGRARRAGFNFVRTWVNFVVWEAEGTKLTSKLQRFVAAANQVSAFVFVFVFVLVLWVLYGSLLGTAMNDQRPRSLNYCAGSDEVVTGWPT